MGFGKQGLKPKKSYVLTNKGKQDILKPFQSPKKKKN